MISAPRIVPSARFVLFTSTFILVFSPVSKAFLNFFRKTFSSIVFCRQKSYLSRGLKIRFLFFINGFSMTGAKSSPFNPGFSAISSLTFNKSVRPISSLSVFTPSFAIHSLTSSAISFIKFSTYSGFPAKRLRSSGFCVAIPTGQVSRLHTRIITQPIATRGAVAKPNSSAPSMAATMTSRPVINLPSVSRTTFERRPFINNVWCVSARPSSHGRPVL